MDKKRPDYALWAVHALLWSGMAVIAVAAAMSYLAE
jgi:hypothetical protein